MLSALQKMNGHSERTSAKLTSAEVDTFCTEGTRILDEETRGGEGADKGTSSAGLEEARARIAELEGMLAAQSYNALGPLRRGCVRPFGLENFTWAEKGVYQPNVMRFSADGLSMSASLHQSRSSQITPSKGRNCYTLRSGCSGLRQRARTTCLFAKLRVCTHIEIGI